MIWAVKYEILMLKCVASTPLVTPNEMEIMIQRFHTFRTKAFLRHFLLINHYRIYKIILSKNININ